MASAAIRNGPRLGRKQIFLPDFTLALLRTPKLPPTFASFIVPLHLNKLDLRDYLYNAYGIEALTVRSYIQMQKLRQDKPNAIRQNPRRWFRPKSIKKMTVEMENPFVWPPEYEEDPADKKMREGRLAEQEELEQVTQPSGRKKPTAERKPLAKQAKAILNGEPWRQSPRAHSTSSEMSSVWEDDVEEVEVEKEQRLPPPENKVDK